MLFQKFAPVAAQGVKITLVIEQADAGKLQVYVMPASESGKSGLGLVSKSFVAFPAELDAEFPEILAAYGASTCTLREQLAAMQAQADQAIKDAEAVHKEKLAQKSKGKVVVPKKAVTPTLTDGDDEDDDDGSGGADDGLDFSASASDSGDDTDGADPVPFTL